MTIRRRIGGLGGAPWRKEYYRRIGATPDSVYLPLTRAAADEGNRDQIGALYDLGFYKYRRAIPFLIRLGREWEARTQAGSKRRLGPVCDALGMMDDPRAHRELIRLYDESADVWVRSDAVDALGYEKRCADPERLIRVLQSDEEGPIRMGAIWAMVEQVRWNTFEPYERVVIEALTDREPIVRGLAADALSRTERLEFRSLIEPLLKDQAHCRFMNNVVADLAREALSVLEYAKK